MKHIIILVVSIMLATNISAQKATIREENISMKSYMFSDPDPVPNIGRIYPYSRFDGFTNNAIDKEWKMVILENDYVKVFVCPDIGGKVWGAIEKSTGKEFLYYNHVVKFRDVAMRGPWTSGGLEFNFGDIGHIPTCATPVDYVNLENEDGSVSCIVGAIDLPSGTKWSIEIRLDPDKAFFETLVSWFNNTTLPNTYYHWMNAAAKADGNLEFIYPGTNYIGHGGEIGQWPLENNRNISWYKNNNFGPYKSYHVVNSYSNFFGGYWHDDDFGFGHLASYDDKPGKKLWIWGLSDQGMIWEDLLTDSDGQYIEFQAGKLLNQAAFSSTFTPFKHREFNPSDADIMREIWFPAKETGGMVAVSEYAILNVEDRGDKTEIIISALQSVNADLTISYGTITIKFKVVLEPLELFTYMLESVGDNDLKIVLGDNLLNYSSKNEDQHVQRPIEGLKEFNWESAYGLYTAALELEKQRSYNESFEGYKSVLKKDPGFLPALSRLSIEYFRRMDYENALVYSRKALSVDTYDPDANYIYGLVNESLGNLTEAKSGFSIAAHSPGTRSAAYLELSKIFLKEGKYKDATLYAEKATNFNKFNISAYEIMAVAARFSGRDTEKYTNIVLGLNALSDFARFENYLSGRISQNEFVKTISNEFPFESYLDLAIKYHKLGDEESAVEVLELSPRNPIVELWISYLKVDSERMDRALDISSHSVFPHRTETASVLKHFIKENDSWTLKYYLGLIYWNKGLIEESQDLYNACRTEPQDFWFWLSKAKLFTENGEIVTASLEKAYKLAPDSWRTTVAMAENLIEKGNGSKASEICHRILPNNKENTKLGLTYAKSLYADGEFELCLAFLEDFIILPYEGSVDGKKMFTRVCTEMSVNAMLNKKYKDASSLATRAKSWPLNLGVGKPYDVDNRLQDFILALIQDKRGRRADYSSVTEYDNKLGRETSLIYLQSAALRLKGKETEALALLKDKMASDTENVYIKWALAKFTNDSSLSQLESDILSKDDRVREFDTKFIDGDFEFLLGILKKMKI